VADQTPHSCLGEPWCGPLHNTIVCDKKLLRTGTTRLAMLAYGMRDWCRVLRRRPHHAMKVVLSVLGLALPVMAERGDAQNHRGSHGSDFSLLTYNVAGLPAVVSRSEPDRNAPSIGELLNLYDIALVQEDFAYHSALAARARHPHRSQAAALRAASVLGDGLSTFSIGPFEKFRRVAWTKCNGRLSQGSDCLTKKGFSVAVHHLAQNATVDIYNVHMDSGSSAADRAARAHQVDQLLAAIESSSANRAVIVAGDTNMDERDDALLSQFLERAALRDACRTLGCRVPRMIDRVMFRGSGEIRLEALHMDLDHRFVREDGEDLSDHKAVGVLFRWGFNAAKVATSEPGGKGAESKPQ
jgi:endonuclease/exonuclease/phosphatase family metal-dependent hydrolase